MSRLTSWPLSHCASVLHHFVKSAIICCSRFSCWIIQHNRQNPHGLSSRPWVTPFRKITWISGRDYGPSRHEINGPSMDQPYYVVANPGPFLCMLYHLSSTEELYRQTLLRSWSCLRQDMNLAVKYHVQLNPEIILKFENFKNNSTFRTTGISNDWRPCCHNFSVIYPAQILFSNAR